MQPVIEPIPLNQELRQLLTSCDMLFSDIGSKGGLRFFGCLREGRLAGAVGLEPYGEFGLLRSLAVSPSFRGEGLGRALVTFVEGEAQSSHIRALYLLTTTAGAFFAQLGYQRAAREDAPPPIRTTSQFSGLCPASSHLMLKRFKLREPTGALSS